MDFVGLAAVRFGWLELGWILLASLELADLGSGLICWLGFDWIGIGLDLVG